MKNTTIILLICLASIILAGCLVALTGFGILVYLDVFNMEQGDSMGQDVADICRLRPTGQGLDCATEPNVNESTVQFEVVNGGPYEAQGIDWDSAPDECSAGTPNFETTNLSSGESAVFNISCGAGHFESGERFDMSFSIEYTTNGQLHSNNAKISGTVS